MQSKLMFAFHDQEKITKKNNVQKLEKKLEKRTQLAKKYWILFQNSDAWRKNFMLTVNSFDIAVSGFVGYGWQIADKAILKKREKFWCALFLCYVYENSILEFDAIGRVQVTVGFQDCRLKVNCVNACVK